MTVAGTYAAGAGGGAYLTGIILIPSGDAGRSKNSRDDSPKKLREEPKAKFWVLQQGGQAPPWDPAPAPPPLSQPPCLPPSQPPSHPPPPHPPPQPPLCSPRPPQPRSGGTNGSKFW